MYPNENLMACHNFTVWCSSGLTPWF